MVDEQQAEITRLQSANAAYRLQISELSEKIRKLDETNNYRVALALTLANAAYDALLVIDKQFNVIAINESAERLFSCKDEALGRSLMTVTQSVEIENMVQDALNNAEEVFEEQVVIGMRIYRVRTQVIQREAHNFIGLALQDITELVRLNRARRDMVANISHELRTPVANIRLIIDSLFHEQSKPRRKQSASALKAIARETDSLLWLVQELLDLSMIESGQAIMRMLEMSALELVDEAVERMSDQSATKDLKIETTVPQGLTVLCDRDQARRILINLIHNAIKWSPEKGTIRISAQNGADVVTFSVLDSGPGVPEDQRERIFERFYQVDDSRSGGEGSGLGLAICKHIVEAHGGQIWAQSNSDGRGGHFLFTLPTGDRKDELDLDVPL